MKIDKLKSNINKLNVKERLELIDFIKNSYSIFNQYAKIEKCPHCSSVKIVKNGVRNNINRFICKDCGKSFTYKSDTILSGIQELNKWNAFVDDFMSLNISSIKDISKKLKISAQTAMDWRHKLLSSLVSRENRFFNDTIEFDESYFLISRKGRRNMEIGNRNTYRRWREGQVGDTDYQVKLFFTYGRNSGVLELFKSHMGRTSAENLNNYFLPNRFQNITTYTDSHRSYSAFFRENNIAHRTFISTDHVNPDTPQVHNQTVNAYTRGFKDFVNKYMRGVSTKYIGLYAKWYEFIVNVKKEIQRKLSNIEDTINYNITDKLCTNVLTDFNGLEYYRQAEFSFLQFLRSNGRTNFGNNSTHYYYEPLPVINFARFLR